LLDEPASNLHSSAQLKILSAIDDLIQDSVVIYSTHSQHLINPQWLNGAYVVLNDAINSSNLIGDLTDTKTSIKVEKYFNYVSEKKQKDHKIYYQPIFDMLDYKCSLVELLPNTIICEGKNDWYTLKYVWGIVMEKPSLNLYPGKGAKNNADVIRLFLCWGEKFVLMLDGDVDAKPYYNKEFKGYVDENVFTLKDVLDESIATEGIFSSADQKKICDAAFGEGSFEKVKKDRDKLKSKFNHSISVLLNNKTTVRLEEETVSKFETLYHFIKAKISNSF